MRPQLKLPGVRELVVAVQAAEAARLAAVEDWAHFLGRVQVHLPGMRPDRTTVTHQPVLRLM